MCWSPLPMLRSIKSNKQTKDVLLQNHQNKKRNRATPKLCSIFIIPALARCKSAKKNCISRKQCVKKQTMQRCGWSLYLPRQLREEVLISSKGPQAVQVTNGWRQRLQLITTTVQLLQQRQAAWWQQHGGRERKRFIRQFVLLLL